MKSIREALDWRYATKTFDATQKISVAQIESLLEVARYTPTSFGLQPIHVTLIEDKSLRERLRPHSYNQSQITDCSHLMVLQSRAQVGTVLVEEYAKLVAETRGQTAAEVKGFRDYIAGYLASRGEAQNVEWAKRQTYIVMGAVLLAAAELEIDACPMEGVNGPEYDKVLDMPGLETVTVIALGRRSTSDANQNLKKVRQPSAKFVTRR